ncbi:hypothetical protein FOXG_19317 [Fusarium oxysporum f. sp. lycopersici 4287]|uniref:Uncharacterized protein n=1 Tax=Fusarium oxysporum f. sp. lycopersici (strain 4287 / CBS 123668 / FGSC 9935 / NRRL 34936) TaxID=426428 RepID=A0A0J9UZG3_FUSO4|nr:hypothetical protein FOXG_19317 [Fusarium oxysporum f. sp. lycopersici 4287]KNB04510.1 hypothetical protein FOXG_19317 [Fusarium oxysporum f. sp. lycopersici 4287]
MLVQSNKITDIIGGWTRRPSTIRLWHSIQLIVGTGLMKRGLISLVGLKRQERWLSDYAHLEVRTSSSRGDDDPPAKRLRFFNPFEKNSRVPNSLPAHAAAIVGDEYQAWQTDRDAATATFVIQLVTGSLSKADILGYPGWPWTS